MNAQTNQILLKKTVLKQPINKMKIIKKDFQKNKSVYLMLIPVVVFYLLFCYKPMYGILMSFQNFTPKGGIGGSEWIGFKHFVDFFQSNNFPRVMKNTLWISANSIVWGFPAPIILALLINELKNRCFARTIQTITYLPYFISIVVICGMIKDFTSDTGIINYFLAVFGFERTPLLQNPSLFVPIYVLSDIWQGIGWGSIVYLAALSGISQDSYEAAKIDGAGRWKQLLHITIPGLMPTISIMFILRLGNIMSVGFEKIILLYSPVTYNSADVVSTFVYRMGLENMSYSFATAVGLFNSVINFTLIMTANTIAKKLDQSTLW